MAKKNIRFLHNMQKTNIIKYQNTFHDLHLTFYKINRDFLFVYKRQLPFSLIGDGRYLYHPDK